MTRTTGAGGIGLIAGALLIASVGAVSAKELKSVGVAVSTYGKPVLRGSGEGRQR